MKKAQQTAARKKTIAHLPAKTRTARLRIAHRSPSVEGLPYPPPAPGGPRLQSDHGARLTRAPEALLLHPVGGYMSVRRLASFDRPGRLAASPGQEKAEWVARGIQVDADVVLGLMPGQDRPGGDRVRACCCQVLDGNIKMHLHLLIARAGGPHRRHVLRLGLERQASVTIVGTQLHPAGLVLLDLPAQQSAIEVRQRACIGRVKDHARQRQPGCLIHGASQRAAIRIGRA